MKIGSIRKGVAILHTFLTQAFLGLGIFDVGPCELLEICKGPWYYTVDEYFYSPILAQTRKEWSRPTKQTSEIALPNMDAPPGHHEVEPYPYDISSVGELLKRKRKARAIKACFPCRHRKVKCDGSLPCSSCAARNHPDLCRVAPVSSVSSPRMHMATLHSPGPHNQAPASPVHSHGESMAQIYAYVMIPAQTWQYTPRSYADRPDQEWK